MNSLYDSFFKSIFENIELISNKNNNYEKISNIDILSNEKMLIYSIWFENYKLININYELLLISDDKIALIKINSYIKNLTTIWHNIISNYCYNEFNSYEIQNNIDENNKFHIFVKNKDSNKNLNVSGSIRINFI